MPCPHHTTTSPQKYMKESHHMLTDTSAHLICITSGPVCLDLATVLLQLTQQQCQVCYQLLLVRVRPQHACIHTGNTHCCLSSQCCDDSSVTWCHDFWALACPPSHSHTNHRAKRDIWCESLSTCSQ
jgi:hypothetical protein